MKKYKCSAIYSILLNCCSSFKFWLIFTWGITQISFVLNRISLQKLSAGRVYVCVAKYIDIRIIQYRKISPASLRKVGALLRYPLVPEIMHGGAHDVFLHQWRRQITLTVLLRRKTQPKKLEKWEFRSLI